MLGCGGQLVGLGGFRHEAQPRVNASSSHCAQWARLQRVLTGHVGVLPDHVALLNSTVRCAGLRCAIDAPKCATVVSDAKEGTD